jgi:hypothetical protein
LHRVPDANLAKLKIIRIFADLEPKTGAKLFDLTALK